MLTKGTIRRIIIATFALLFILIIYLFPNASDEEVYEQSIEYQNINKEYVYLIDKDDYVARIDMVMKYDDVLTRIKAIIDSLTISGSNYVPNGFSAVIPENTTLLDYSFDDGLVKLNFSKEFLTVSEKYENHMIESIVYSLTEIEEVKKVIIMVEGNIIIRLPHSNKKIPHYLTRNYGINKIFNITTYKDVSSTTIYYLNEYNDNYYYVPVTNFSNDQSNAIEIVIESLKSTPIIQNDLLSYMVSNVELLGYEVKENSVSLNFNNYIFNDLSEKDISEEVKYSIFLSLKDNLNIKNVIFNVDGEKISDFSLDN